MQPGDGVTVDDGSYAGFWMKNRQGDAQHRFTFRAKNPLGAMIIGVSATASDPNDSVQLVSVSFATIDGFDVSGAPRAGISIRTFGDDTGADTTDNVVQNCRSHDNGAGVTAGRHDGIFTGFAQNVLLQNNEVDHNSEHGIYVSNSADNPIFRGNRSHDNTANGLQINADGSTGGDGVISNWLMEDNIVYANGGAAAINLDGATFGVLRNNLVFGNARGGIALFMGDSNEASHDNVVVDNTVYDPSGTRFAIQIDNGADNNVVFDNVFWSASSGMEIGAVNGLVHDYNAVSSYVGGSASPNEITVSATQLFVNVSTNDYHSGPALMGRGTGTLGGATAPTTDLDGNARPQGGAYDIGCYQHLASGTGTASGGDAGQASRSASDAASGDARVADGPVQDSAMPEAASGDGSTADSAAEGAPEAAANEGGGSDAGEPPGRGVDAQAESDSADVAPGDREAGGDALPSPWDSGAGSSGKGCSSSPSPGGGAGALFMGIVVFAMAVRRR